MKRDNASIPLLRLLLVLGLLWLTPSLALAALTDLPDADGKGYFVDESTSYVWMDVDNFYGMSYDAIEASLAGTDFHIATTDEVNQMLASAGTDFAAIAETMGYSVRSSLIWGLYSGGDEVNGNYQSYYLASNNPTMGWRPYPLSASLIATSPDLGAFVVNTTPPAPPEETAPPAEEPPPVETAPPAEEPPPPAEPATVTADVEMAPHTLLMGCRGYLVTAYIELPEGYAVEDIDPLSINVAVVNDLVVDPPLYTVGPVTVGDHDDDGIADLMVKFDRQDLLELVESGENEVVVVGELADGTVLEGLASLDVRSKSNWMRRHHRHCKWHAVKKIVKHKGVKRCHR